MARGNSPGKDFDDQWNNSRRRGEYRASRGEGPYSADKYLERNNERLGRQPASHRGESKGCGEKTVVLAALLGGIGWFVSEIVNRVA
jgi:hypothetical protein